MVYHRKTRYKRPNTQNNTGEDYAEDTQAKGIEWVLLGLIAIFIWAGFKHYIDITVYVFMVTGFLAIKTEGGKHW